MRFRHPRLKVLSKRENRAAVVNELGICYECDSEAELQEMRLRSLEEEGE